MKKKSLVKYIGGQDKVSKKHYPLKTDILYTVEDVCEAKFGKEWRKAVKLAEMSEVAFDRTMFVEIKPKVEVDLNDIYNRTKFNILNNFN